MEHCVLSILQVADLKTGATVVVELYGNHDVWSATFPLLTPVEHVRSAFNRIGRIHGLHGPWPDRQVSQLLLDSGSNSIASTLSHRARFDVR